MFQWWKKQTSCLIILTLLMFSLHNICIKMEKGIGQRLENRFPFPFFFLLVPWRGFWRRNFTFHIFQLKYQELEVAVASIVYFCSWKTLFWNSLEKWLHACFRTIVHHKFVMYLSMFHFLYLTEFTQSNQAVAIKDRMCAPTFFPSHFRYGYACMRNSTHFNDHSDSRIW